MSTPISKEKWAKMVAPYAHRATSAAHHQSLRKLHKRYSIVTDTQRKAVKDDFGSIVGHFTRGNRSVELTTKGAGFWDHQLAHRHVYDAIRGVADALDHAIKVTYKRREVSTVYPRPSAG